MLEEVLSATEMIALGPMLFLGDVNAVSDVTLDIHGCILGSSSMISSLLKSYALIDAKKKNRD